MRYVSIVMAFALGVAACGSNDTEAASGDDAPASPIAEFLGEDANLFDPGNQDDAEAKFIEEERVRQGIIADCMQREGFEYVPTDPENTIFFGSDDGQEWGSEEWTAKYGFGITTQRFSQEEVGPDLVGFDDSGFQDSQENDPNQEIVEAMGEVEQAAYYEALYGDQAFFGEADETLSEEEQSAQGDDFEWKPDGCEGEAYAEDTTSRFYTDFGDELDEMWERMQSDPRVTEFERGISECVAEQGLDYTNMMDLYERFEGEIEEIDAEVGFPGSDLTEEDFAEMSEEELDAIFSQPRELSESAKTRLGELQEEEIALAVAVDGCGGSVEEQEKIFSDIAIEYEQEFLDANADRLAEYQGE